MPEQKHDINDLLNRFAARTATEQELDQLFVLLKNGGHDEPALHFLEQEMARFQAEGEDRSYWADKPSPLNKQAISIADRSAIRSTGSVLISWRASLKTWLPYAAALIIIAGVALFIYNNKHLPAIAIAKTELKPTTGQPGGSKALLTLADGSTLILDATGNGIIAQQGSARIVKNPNGQIVYHAGTATSGAAMMNTMSTARGGQYQLVLPDGTKVWLNAESSIRYPTVFAGAKRSVRITGEVYFEVTADKQKPFWVDVDGRSSVQVLGTSFNINSYPDDNNIKTTLLEGSIKVISTAKSHSVTPATGSDVILRPGQQAIEGSMSLTGKSGTQPVNAQQDNRHNNPDNSIAVINNTDLTKVMAWKNGLFNFEGADVKAVMSQLIRWYNIRVSYEGKIPDIKFGGELSRDLQLSQIIRILSKVGLKFRLDGETLVVSDH